LVSHVWFGFEFGKFPLIIPPKIRFSPSGQKKFLQVGSKSTPLPHPGKTLRFLSPKSDVIGLSK